MRKGALLVEVLIAVAIAAGSLLLTVNAIQSSVAGARFNADRTSARLALIDVTEILLGTPTDALRQMGRPGSEAWVDTALQERMSHLPAAARDQYQQEVTPFLGRFSFTFEENVDARAPGLARLTLSVRIGEQSTLTVVRLFRPEDREQPGP